MHFTHSWNIILQTEIFCITDYLWLIICFTWFFHAHLKRRGRGMRKNFEVCRWFMFLQEKNFTSDWGKTRRTHIWEDVRKKFRAYQSHVPSSWKIPGLNKSDTKGLKKDPEIFGLLTSHFLMYYLNPILL